MIAHSMLHIVTHVIGGWRVNALIPNVLIVRLDRKNQGKMMLRRFLSWLFTPCKVQKKIDSHRDKIENINFRQF